jgi:general secretion pathway protein D
MKLNRTLSVLAAALVLGVGSQAAFAQGASVKKVDINLKDAELLTALQALHLQSGLEYSIQINEKDRIRLVTVRINDRTPEEAIRYICDAAGVTVERDETGVFIVRTPGAATNPAPTVRPTRSLPPRKIMVMKADPEILYRRVLFGEIVDPAQSQEDLMKLQGRLTPKLGVTELSSPRLSSENSTSNLTAPTPTTAAPYKAAGPFELPEESSGQRGGGMGAGGGGFAGGQPGGGGFGGGQPGGGGLGGGQPGGGGGGGLGLQGGQGFVPEGITRFSYDPIDNSIVVQGTEEAIAELTRIIEQFDVAAKQVHIDVKYITTSNSRDRSFGIDWLYQRGGVFAGNRPGSFARVNDPVFINYATGNITTRLRTILTDGWGRVVNNPSVTTMNNQPAVFLAQTATTIFINQIISNANGIIIAPQPQQVTIQSGISVRPRINNDGSVTMTINTQLGDFGQLRRGADGTEIPDFLNQSVNVAVRVKSGDTVALGGLNRKLDNYSRSRIPVLGDLPIIGQLFQGRNEQLTSQDLTIFVTPTILDESGAGIIP